MRLQRKSESWTPTTSTFHPATPRRGDQAVLPTTQARRPHGHSTRTGCERAGRRVRVRANERADGQRAGARGEIAHSSVSRSGRIGAGPAARRMKRRRRRAVSDGPARARGAGHRAGPARERLQKMRASVCQGQVSRPAQSAAAPAGRWILRAGVSLSLSLSLSPSLSLSLSLGSGPRGQPRGLASCLSMHLHLSLLPFYLSAYASAPVPLRLSPEDPPGKAGMHTHFKYGAARARALTHARALILLPQAHAARPPISRTRAARKQIRARARPGGPARTGRTGQSGRGGARG